MWYYLSGDNVIVCTKCKTILNKSFENEPFCYRCLNGTVELKEKIKKAEEAYLSRRVVKIIPPTLAVEVHECAKCPKKKFHATPIDQDDWVECTVLGRRIDALPRDGHTMFPDWCPLENKKEIPKQCYLYDCRTGTCNNETGCKDENCPQKSGELNREPFNGCCP